MSREAAGLVLSEAFMWRHNPQTVRLRALLDEGAIGNPRLVRASFSFPLAATTDVRLDPALDGGALMDVGCYCVSGARLVGRQRAAERVGRGRHRAERGRPAVDRAAALRAATCSRRSTAASTWRGAASSRSSAPTAASCSPTRGTPAHRGSCSSAPARTPEVIDVEPVNSYRLELEDMAAAIAGERPPLLGRDDAVGQARAIEALYRAAEHGGGAAVPVPVASA